MSVYISTELRIQVKLRAFSVCEYCLIHEDDVFFSFHIDHIVSLKHGGKTSLNNLSYSCAICNREKGTDLGSIYDGNIIRFYNPRIDKWLDHFKLEGGLILALTPIGEVTRKIFKFNDINRIAERELLTQIQAYPSNDAVSLLRSH